jgi:hypothetical protein
MFLARSITSHLTPHHSFFSKNKKQATMATLAVSSSSSNNNNMSSTSTTTATSEGEVDTVYNDLLNFLKSSRADLRKAAAEATLATLVNDSSSSDNTNDNNVAQRLTTLNVIQPLCRIASTISPDHGSISALAALSVLCSHEQLGNQCIIDFMDAKGIGRMLEIALSSPPTPVGTAASISSLDKQKKNGGDEEEGKSSSKLAQEWNVWRQQVNYACALLANATRTERGAVDFIGLSFPEEAIPSNTLSGRGVKNNKEGDDEDGKEIEAEMDEEEGDGAGNGGVSAYGKRETKPTATLLLSRFLNSAFIDTSSPAHDKAIASMTPKNKLDGRGLDEYDSDLDDDNLDDDDDDEPDMKNELEPQKMEPMGEEYYDPYQHVAAVIMNITQLDTGREFLMRLVHSEKKENSSSSSNNNKKNTQSTSHLQSLLPQLNSPNLHRRQGIAGTLKNCCFSQDSIWWLLNVVHMDKSLLLLLAGPEELDIDEKVGLDPDYWLLGPQKVREPDSLVRLYVTEALLLLLASGRRARETLRERRMYVIIKLADMVEENEEVSERMLECVQYLRRDEEGTEEGSSDKRAYEKYARGLLDGNVEKNKGLKALPMSTTATAAATAAATTSDIVGNEEEEDYDNID